MTLGVTQCTYYVICFGHFLSITFSLRFLWNLWFDFPCVLSSSLLIYLCYIVYITILFCVVHIYLFHELECADCSCKNCPLWWNDTINIFFVFFETSIVNVPKNSFLFDIRSLHSLISITLYLLLHHLLSIFLHIITKF